MALSAQSMRKIAKELKDLNSTPLEGITLVPNEQDMTEVVAIIDGPGITPLFHCIIFIHTIIIVFNF